MKLYSGLVFTLIAGTTFATSLPLSAPKAPFVKQSSAPVSNVPIKGFLNADNLIFTFGNKKIIVDPCGTFTIMADGRKVASSYFTSSTPAKSWNSNIGKKVVKEYDHSGMSIMSCTADSAAGTITIKGMLGFNKPGTPEEAYPWTRTFALTKDNKVLVTTNFSVPDKKLVNSKCGLFFNLFQTNDFTAKPVNRGDARAWHIRTADITVNTKLPDDSFTIEVLSPMMIQENGRKTSIYLTPESYTWKIAIDLGKCKTAQPHMPGGVDFKRGDDFSLPSTGKNLLANPYFAQGQHLSKIQQSFSGMSASRPVCRQKM